MHFDLLANDFKEAIQRVVKLKGQYHARPNHFNQNTLLRIRKIFHNHYMIHFNIVKLIKTERENFKL